MQSRGRARCDNSRVVVLLSEQLRGRREELERRERLMKMALSVLCDEVPSARAKRCIREIRKQLAQQGGEQDLVSTAAQAPGSCEGSAGDLVVRLICFGVHCDAARLKEAICASLENSALGLHVSSEGASLVPLRSPRSILSNCSHVLHKEACSNLSGCLWCCLLQTGFSVLFAHRCRG